jgi:hypothetical protein
MNRLGNVICDDCGMNLEHIKDEFEPPGTFYHSQNHWYDDMLPKILPSSSPCPNAGKKFIFNEWNGK